MITATPTITAPIATFLDALFEPADLVQVRLLPGGKNYFVKAAGLEELADRFAEENRAGQNIYFGANPRKCQGGKAEDVALARFVFVDLDNCTIEDAKARVADAVLPDPTGIVSSGHGVHCYWRLTEPLTDLKGWSAAQRHLAAMLDGDRVHDPPRLMRLPGFINHKPPPAPCTLVEADPSRRYPLAELVPPDDKQRAGEFWLSRALQRAQGGNRNDVGFWLCCQLRDSGLSEAQAKGIVIRYAEQQDCDYTEGEAMRTVRSAYAEPAREPAGNGHGLPRYKIPEEPDPPIVLLDDEELPEITPDVLPAWARDFVLEMSAAKEVSPTLATLLQLATLASSVQRAYRVQIEPSYFEPLCVYVAPSLESGERKTAIHGPVVKPLFELQKRLRSEAARQQREAGVRERLIAQEIKVLERRYLDAQDEAQRQEIATRLTELAGQIPEKIAPPQLVVEDFTEAALSIALAGNKESLLATSDEGGIFDNLCGRFSDVAEIDLFLKAHCGSPCTVNRVGRANIVLTRPLLSVGISPQPAVLASLGKKPGFLSRGLVARFLWALPNSNVGSRSLKPATVCPEVVEAYRENLTALALAGWRHDGDPLTIRLSPEAHETWKTFERDLEPRLAPEGDLAGIKAWASKLPGAVARVAAICHCAEHGDRADKVAVGLDQMKRAVELGRNLIPHANAAHRLMGQDGISTAQAVVRHYNRAGWPSGTLTLTEWWRPVRKLVGATSRMFEPVARTLVDHGYLIPVEQPGPGRHGQHYQANRASFSGFPKVLYATSDN